MPKNAEMLPRIDPQFMSGEMASAELDKATGVVDCVGGGGGGDREQPSPRLLPLPFNDETDDEEDDEEQDETFIDAVDDEAAPASGETFKGVRKADSLDSTIVSMVVVSKNRSKFDVWCCYQRTQAKRVVECKKVEGHDVVLITKKEKKRETKGRIKS